MWELHEGGWREAEIAAKLEVHQSTVNRQLKRKREELAAEKLAVGWKPPAVEFPENVFDLEPRHLEDLVKDFLGFRPTFFTTARGKPYVTPPFQVRWLRRILHALVTGGRLVILSPPRHGKTELLIHVVVWLICRFPNIRIIWVGGNIDIAKQAVGSVLDHLENNEALIRTFCAPGTEFKPRDRQGVQWTQIAFKVATRTIRGLKQPTLRAVGRGGRLRSQDTDFIINDDIEDEKSTIQAATREETRRWWTTGPDSRKEEHSALFYIGSRAHPDDLGGHLLENEAYDQVVEQAHSLDCELDPLDVSIHIDCMLFPELRSYKWLMEQKMSSQTVGGIGIYEMLYQNLPTGDGFDMFTAEAVHPCRSKDHIVGQMPTDNTGPIHLVAGLDPSGTGYQAAFLWAYQVEPELKMWMVDLENREGGGIAAARQTIRNWHELYQIPIWVVEYNLFLGGIVDDTDIADFAARAGIRLEHFRTYRQKQDPRLGVTSLQPLFADRRIVLPYGDAPSKAKTDIYVRQMLHYDPRASQNRNSRAGYKSDVLMASWFPLDVIRREQTEFFATIVVDYEPMYAGLSFFDADQPMWEVSSF